MKKKKTDSELEKDSSQPAQDTRTDAKRFDDAMTALLSVSKKKLLEIQEGEKNAKKNKD